MKVYVITAGEYSGYHIVGVTLDRDVAEKVLRAHDRATNVSCMMIEEYDTDVFQAIHDGMKLWKVRLRGGALESGECDDYEYAYCMSEVNYVSSFKSNRIFADNRKTDTVYTVIVLAEDREHAEKIGMDLITKHQYRRKVDETK